MAERKIRGETVKIALEVKWVKSPQPNIQRDLEKLKAFIAAYPEGTSCICVFGKKADIGKLAMGDHFKEQGDAVYCEIRKTEYGCRIFRLQRD